MHSLKWGAAEQSIIKQAERNGFPVPPELQNKPELRLGLSFFYSAFLDLHSTRPFTEWGAGAISYISIAQWCAVNDVSGELRDDTLYLIPRMDSAYLSFERDKAKQAAKNAAPAKNGKFGPKS